jgi:hypothetical protein
MMKPLKIEDEDETLVRWEERERERRGEEER